MSVNIDKLREMIRELIMRELKEASMTGNIDGGAGPPKTPNAFKKKKDDDEDKESGYQEGHQNPNVGTTFQTVKEHPHKNFDNKRAHKPTPMLKEGRYHDWRNDESLTPKQKIGLSVREVKNSLSGLEKTVKMNVRLKKELKVGSTDYWKTTHTALTKINERLVKLSKAIANLY
jgi:hypothetical protein